MIKTVQKRLSETAAKNVNAIKKALEKRLKRNVTDTEVIDLCVDAYLNRGKK